MDSVFIENQPIKCTPMMEQWEKCKKVAKKAVLLFRMGDFYEAFYDDAQLIAKELELTLTQRQGVPMSGVPHHTCESYVDRLVAKGFCVAIAEQVEDPRLAKGLVKREVVRIITPSTHISSAAGFEKTNSFLASISQVGSIFGLSVCDISTGEFKACECENIQELMNELFLRKPKEIVVALKLKEKYKALFEELNLGFSPLISIMDAWNFDPKIATGVLSEHFRLHHLDCFGLKGMVAAINACGGLLAYLKDELNLPISHIRTIEAYVLKSALMIDKTCARNLELTEPLLLESNTPTLLSVIDKTLTPMGGRLIRAWLKAPLNSVAKIEERQEAVAAFLSAPKASLRLLSLLKDVRDLERLMMKIEAGFASPRDLGALRFSLRQIVPIREVMGQVASPLLAACWKELEDLTSLRELLERALEDELPARITEGNIFRSGYLLELDELKEIARGGKNWIATYQNDIRDETGIKTLKVSYNKIFGYYIEVSKGQAHLMPDAFKRQQTLVNCERFTSPALKEHEAKVFSAEEKIGAIEADAFNALRREIAKFAEPILKIAHAIGLIDTLLAFAENAKENRYCRPVIDESSKLEIVEGKHPVIEKSLGLGEFVPNDTKLDGEKENLMIITGPNMAGKSTYIRQVALIVILAQMGSFVPAKKAHIGLCDKIFSRIGASDDLARGQSTFMVEMSETANILNNATSKSLVILDEIGRGTSTFDGVAIAWAVADYLLKTPQKRAKTLFATHYFELTQLNEGANYNVSVQDWNDTILFTHKIVSGAADKSYGIHVAKLAGLPFDVVKKATEILKELESKKKNTPLPKKERQLSLFPEPIEPSISLAEKEVLNLDIESMTPIAALNFLSALQNKLKNDLR